MGVDEIIGEINKLSVLEIVDLKDKLQEQWGVEAAAPVVVAAAPAGAEAAAAEEKTEFAVKITEIGENKIQVIKAVRELTSLGLKEAKELVESAPDAVVASDISQQQADDMKAKLEETGAGVLIE